MASKAKLSYNNAVKKGLQPQKPNRAPPRAPAQPKPVQQTTDHTDPPLDPVSWSFADQVQTSWFEPPKKYSDDWEYSHWADGPRELVIHWEQGVYDALNGKEPATMTEFFDKLEHGLLPCQQPQPEPSNAAWFAEDAWATKVDADAWQVHDSHDPWAVHEPQGNNAGQMDGDGWHEVTCKRKPKAQGGMKQSGGRRRASR